ncbi:phosphotransferase family protein [Streptomyces chrestomyceticus]|uniref:phosphotransferase family protein n=1 Tax=Streptomyces chrestomyceticus TaxID=68185 RepID=UPI0033DA6FAD
MPETPLPGGFVQHVVRVGATVRRPASATTAFVGELLKLFEARGRPGAPRYLGIGEDGRETLTYLDGYVAWEREQSPAVYAAETLERVARLVREFHDLTAGTDLAGAHEVVCHNDLAPRNTVYRPVGGTLRPVAFIDWDLAAPGERVHDVAHVCWQYIGLGPRVEDVADSARRLRLVADTYGLTDRDGLIPAILWWQDRCRRGIEAGARAGDPAMVRLRDAGVVTEVRDAFAWVGAHRDVLARALR